LSLHFLFAPFFVKKMVKPNNFPTPGGCKPVSGIVCSDIFIGSIPKNFIYKFVFLPILSLKRLRMPERLSAAWDSVSGR